MAYFSQDTKALLAPRIRALLKKYNCRGTVSVRNNSTLVCTISSGPFDLLNGHTGRTYQSINVYWLHEHYTGPAGEFLVQLRNIMNDGNWNNSDIQSDYFDVGWYIEINAGKWDRPYTLTNKTV